MNGRSGGSSFASGRRRTGRTEGVAQNPDGAHSVERGSDGGASGDGGGVSRQSGPDGKGVAGKTTRQPTAEITVGRHLGASRL